MRAEIVARITRLYPFLSGCGTLANHSLVNALAGQPKRDAWAKVEGGKILVSLDDYVGRAAFFVGDLDRKVSAIVDRFVQPGHTVLDIGANVGLVSLRLAKRVGALGIVHAFEPNPAVAQRLATALEASNVANVQLHQCALGCEEAILKLSVPDGNAGAASLLSGKGFDVPVKRLDEFDFGPIGFIKMDVEGFEDKVLHGFSRTLSTTPPRTILFEQNDDSGGSIPILKDAGYRVFGIAKSLFKLRLVPVSAWQADFHDYVAVYGREALL
jgi:FkbM family methyltransferase